MNYNYINELAGYIFLVVALLSSGKPAVSLNNILLFTLCLKELSLSFFDLFGFNSFSYSAIFSGYCGFSLLLEISFKGLVKPSGYISSSGSSFLLCATTTI